MKYWTYSEKGSRERNEDRILVHEYPNKTKLLAIADGMGGYAEGATAAELVIQTLKDFFDNKDVSSWGPKHIQQAFKQANDRIKAYRLEKLNNAKMGATMAMVLNQGDTAICAWAGDCRIYYFNKEGIAFQSTDHTLENEWKRNGLDEDFPVARKYQRIITKSISGETEGWEPSLEELQELSTGDKFLLCTDGFQFPFGGLEMIEENSLQQLLEGMSMKDNASLVFFQV